MSTYGIIFAGTPHQGGEGVKWAARVAMVASIFVNTNDNLLNHLERDSEEVQRLLRDFAPISNEFVIKFAYETLPTKLPTGGSIHVGVVRLLLTIVLTGNYRLYLNPPQLCPEPLMPNLSQFIKIIPTWLNTPVQRMTDIRSFPDTCFLWPKKLPEKSMLDGLHTPDLGVR